jgi:hypothetical protein
MKIFYNARLLLLLSLLVSVSILSSCKKDDESSASSATELLSFGPTGAMHGDTLIFIGNNLQNVTEIDLTGAVVPKASFLSQSNEQILLIVPQSTEKGYVTLKTAAGDIVSKTMLNLQVVPVVTEMTKEARPGENVTLKGDYLNWVTTVTFAQDKPETTFVSKSLNQLVVKIPDDAKSGKLILTFAGTEPGIMETDSILVVTLPMVTKMTPNPVLHTDDLSIDGTNLDLVKSIIFNGVSTPVTSFMSQSESNIVVIVPRETTKGKISLVAASGVSTQSPMDLDVVLPSITTFTPNPIKPEDNLTITGAHLDLVSGISFVGAASAVTSFVSRSPTQIVVKVPLGTLKGLITLSVMNSSLIVQSSTALDILGGLPALADFPLPIYTDAFQSGFQDWSWATRNIASTEIVRQGDKSIKATYKAYEGITFHAGTDINTSTYSKLELSMFGGPGTGGKNMQIVINGGWGTPYIVKMTEGEWTTYSIPISALGSPNPLKEIVLQAAFDGVAHIDHVGLR